MVILVKYLYLLVALYKLYADCCMKYILLILPWCLAAQLALSQSHQIRIGRYVLPEDNPTEKYLIVKMPFGKHSVEHIYGDTNAFKKAGEVTVDIICTDYPPEQSLVTLNANRLKSFYNTFPFIKPVQVNKVHYYRQTGGAERDKAEPMFHGVVIRWRVAQTKETTKDDWKRIEEMLAGPLPIKRTSLRQDGLPGKAFLNTREKIKPDSAGRVPYNDPSMSFAGKRITFIIGDTAYLHKHFTIADSLPVYDFKTAHKKNLISKKVYQQFKTKPGSYITLFEPLPEVITIDTTDAIIDTVETIPPRRQYDSTVTQVLKRKRWRNTAVVADVTGSMYPYTGQLLAWLQQYSLTGLGSEFAFFNDGDDRPDEKKKIGKTGGIYYQQCFHYLQVKELAKLAMQRGTGGDFPENVIEALLMAEKQFPRNDAIILIADNWADIRDKELTGFLRKPVRIILCGVKNNDINIDYLNLAYKTRGTIHMMEEDIESLASLKDGDTLTLGKKNYKLKSGELVEAE